MNFLAVYRNLEQKVSALYDQLKLKFLEQATGRPRSLTTIQTLTLALYWKTQDVTTKKALWRDFSPNCTYKTFVVTLNRFAVVALLILSWIVRSNRASAHLVKHTDSTDIPVCLNKNAKRHRTMEGFAAWGHSGKGWFYGLKLHLTADLKDRVLALSFTPGNTDDRSQFMTLNKDLSGIFVADAGYVSRKLTDTFDEEGRRILFAKPYTSMKKLITAWQYHLYNTRVKIESNFRSLKLFRGLVTSLPRSLDGYLGNYVYALLAHVVA